MKHSEWLLKMAMENIGLSLNAEVTRFELSPLSLCDGQFVVKGMRYEPIGGHYEIHLGNDAWQDVNYVDEDMLEVAVMEMLDRYEELKKARALTIIESSYKVDGSIKQVSETVIYEDKKMACKDTIKNKRLHKDFKMKIIHKWEDAVYKKECVGDSVSNVMSEEELASIALY